MSIESRLEWFRDHAGSEGPFPDPLPNGDLLATHAKGIYKPAGYEYALSIRTQIDSKYRDGIFVPIFNNGWAFAYHQETDKRLGSKLFTNQALDLNVLHNIPVGVLQQIENQASKSPTYFVHGLAVPIHKAGAYYILCDERSANLHSRTQILNEFYLANANFQTINEDIPDLNNDLGVSAFKAIIARQGQGKFRREIIRAYDGICAISGEKTIEVLDAAHIRPYQGTHTNQITNGLLLRTDLHNLFDFNLIAINPSNYEIRVSAFLESSFYRQYDKSQLSLPASKNDHPDLAALTIRWNRFNDLHI